MRNQELVLLLLGLVYLVTFGVLLVGFAGPDWVHTSRVHRGLWQECGRSQPGCRSLLRQPELPLPGYWAACQACLCLALTAALLGLASHVAWTLWVCRDCDHRSRAVRWSSTVAWIGAFLAAAFCLLSTIIFGAKAAEVPNGYAYWMTVLSAVLFVLTGGLDVLVSRK